MGEIFIAQNGYIFSIVVMNEKKNNNLVLLVFWIRIFIFLTEFLIVRKCLLM